MTLYELGLEYEESAIPIRKRLAELRQALENEQNANERWYIKRRIAELTPMLTQCNKIAEYCKNYYEPGYYIGDGALAKRRTRYESGDVKQLATQGTALHLEKGIDRCRTGNSRELSIRDENIHGLCKRKGGEQIDRIKKLLQGFE